jgi:peptide deformylase
MNNLNIVIYPDETLRKQSEPLTTKEISSKYVQNLISSMIATMKKNNGIGLAAPQIGVNKQIITIDTSNAPLVLINPFIIKKSWAQITNEEGCLSIPNIVDNVKRHKSISVKTFTSNGQQINFTAKNLLARVIQHEVDHLNGILFIDKTDNYNKKE